MCTWISLCTHALCIKVMLLKWIKYIMILPVTWFSHSGYSAACRTFPQLESEWPVSFSFLSLAWHIARLDQQWALQTHCQLAHQRTTKAYIPKARFLIIFRNWFTPSESKRRRANEPVDDRARRLSHNRESYAIRRANESTNTVRLRRTLMR